jgi:chromate reductase
MKILTISGSLRVKSTNTALVRALTSLAPEDAEVVMAEGIAALPHFSPELDGAAAPVSVIEWRRQLEEADGVLICTPEYAFGMPGSLKNALDWVVASGELWRKPVAVISASPSALGGEKAHAALLLTLTALESQIVEAASLTIPFVSTKVNAEGTVTDEATMQSLKSSLDALVQAIRLPKQSDE